MKKLSFSLVLLLLVQSLFAQVNETGKYKAESWQTYLLPGVGYDYYDPGKASWGTYQGYSIQFVLFSDYTAPQHTRKSSGPALKNIYGRLGFLSSSHERPSLLHYTIGANASFENRITRSWLIPYFGMEAGGMAESELVKHTTFQPYIGLYWFAQRNLRVSTQIGSLVLMNKEEVIRGTYGSLTLQATLWR